MQKVQSIDLDFKACGIVSEEDGCADQAAMNNARGISATPKVNSVCVPLVSLAILTYCQELIFSSQDPRH